MEEVGGKFIIFKLLFQIEVFKNQARIIFSFKTDQKDTGSALKHNFHKGKKINLSRT